MGKERIGRINKSGKDQELRIPTHNMETKSCRKRKRNKNAYKEITTHRTFPLL